MLGLGWNGGYDTGAYLISRAMSGIAAQWDSLQQYRSGVRRGKRVRQDKSCHGLEALYHSLVTFLGAIQ